MRYPKMGPMPEGMNAIRFVLRQHVEAFPDPFWEILDVTEVPADSPESKLRAMRLNAVMLLEQQARRGRTVTLEIMFVRN